MIDLNLVKLSSRYLYIGNCLISLHGKKRTFQLIEVLLQHKDGIYHDDLRTLMFGRTSNNPRILKAQNVSLEKLITRTRTMIRDALAETEWAKKVQWCVYRDRDDSWKFIHVLA